MAPPPLATCLTQLPVAPPTQADRLTPPPRPSPPPLAALFLPHPPPPALGPRHCRPCTARAWPRRWAWYSLCCVPPMTTMGSCSAPPSASPCACGRSSSTACARCVGREAVLAMECRRYPQRRVSTHPPPGLCILGWVLMASLLVGLPLKSVRRANHPPRPAGPGRLPLLPRSGHGDAGDAAAAADVLLLSHASPCGPVRGAPHAAHLAGRAAPLGGGAACRHLRAPHALPGAHCARHD